MKYIRIAKLFSVSLLEILTVEVCFSSDRQKRDNYDCNGRRGESSYIVSANQMSWPLANEFCRNKSSSLLVIQNESQQNAFETYLNKCPQSIEPRIHSVWTSGKRETYANWTWINGQTLDFTSVNASNYSDSSRTHVMLRTRSMTAEPPSHHAWYLCQHKDHQCNGKNQVNLTNGCVIPSEYGNTSWYESRNECLSKGGDLAVLTEQDLQSYNNNILNKTNYWIGLRKVMWNWKTSRTNQEVKYTKWPRQGQATSGDLCISIDTADGQWRALQCNNTMSVVCEKQDQIPTSTTMKPTIKTSTVTIYTTAAVSGNGMSRTTKSPNGGDSTSSALITDNGMTVTTSPALIIGVTSVGVVIIIVCIIVIAIALRRTSKSSTTKTEPKTDELKLQKTKEQKPKETAEVLKNDDARCVYADIPPAEKTANDQPGAGQPGIVYASLEFDQAVTYAEPMKRKSQNAVDSVGPIYAEPFEAMGSQNGTTSTSSPSGQATKIGPMGDVYTLPSPNISSPSANMTQSPIYANTQT